VKRSTTIQTVLHLSGLLIAVHGLLLLIPLTVVFLCGTLRDIKKAVKFLE
jgi:hypothetical protein